MNTLGLSRLRRSAIVLVVWLTLIFNIERYLEPINLASFLYVLTALQTAVILCSPRLSRRQFWLFTFVNLLLYATLKSFLGYQFLGSYLPITVTECVVIWATNFFSASVSSEIDDVVQAAREIASMQMSQKPLSLQDGEALMYNEVQRARRFDRKLSLAAVRFDRNQPYTEFERLLEKVREVLVDSYVEARVGAMLLKASSPGDLVVLHDEEFVLLCPELSGSKLRSLLAGVSKELFEELGIKIQVGISEFPAEECTLAGLIAKAESEVSWLVAKCSDEGQADDFQIQEMDKVIATKETLECR